ncbi:thermonuclease family protein [Pullulanibacillus sp. KACC 23026]|uniref:thermonuclease family protein n=1 Tax=Pullulanibacillus sp. KACC 23026 TaxID=3028315 RepID=UPI0023B047ED|nr:thermonuclease family protein [Pullulanibacillus sp. KACC 23026]WEG12230.1 thermonuclease family protein [Pullulanibacillus sp. KACC 23026]
MKVIKQLRYSLLALLVLFLGYSGLGTTNNVANASTKLVPAVVSKNVDGDTIHVKINGKDQTVRMLLIDTPEDVDPQAPVEPYSYTAASYAKKRLPVGKHIYLQEGKKGYTKDKYGRLLAYVYRTKTDMYNYDVVKKGYARVAYIYPPNTDHLSTLQSAQSYAKSHKLGIWSLKGYVTSSGYSHSISCSYAAKNHYSTRTCTPSSSSSSKSSASSSTSVTGTTLNVKHGQYASVTVKTKHGAKGTIEVDYKSGPSHASGLGAKTANSSGMISWKWRVGTNTTPGKYPVIIRVNGSTIKKTLTVH